MVCQSFSFGRASLYLQKGLAEHVGCSVIGSSQTRQGPGTVMEGCLKAQFPNQWLQELSVKHRGGLFSWVFILVKREPGGARGKK